MHPFRFGISTPPATDRDEWVAAVRRIEDLGFDTLSVYDHLTEAFEPFISLAIAAETTRSIRLGTLVLNNDLRHPALLAREAASLATFCGERLELGLGAGHSAHEYVEIGASFDAPAIRVSRLEESVAILKPLLRGERVEFHGDHYSINGHRVLPEGIPSPSVPLLIGGNGKRLLRLAAREADIVGFTGLGRTLEDGQRHEPSGFTASAVAERIDLVRAEAGERLSELELHALVQVVRITDDRQAAAEELAARLPPLTPSDVLATPFLLVGTVDEIVDELLERRETLGINYYTTFAPHTDALARIVTQLAGR